jgi:phospholipid-binding lipoprotein MlaA
MAVFAAGCASQNTSADLPRTPPRPPAEDQLPDASDGLSEEEALLLEDDFDDFEETESTSYTVADPIEPFNRAMFQFNDKLYSWVLRPLTLGYRKIAPQPVRTGIGNFFHNLTAPLRMVNCILQGKGQAAAAEFASFTLNTVYGILGFMDVTKDYPELNPDPEDLGQTLGRYRIGDGFYIVWPLLGSSTLRDTVGRVGDAFFDPVSYVEPPEASIAARGFRTVNTLSFRIEDIDTAKKASLDPYQAARDFYIQSRQLRVKK